MRTDAELARNQGHRIGTVQFLPKGSLAARVAAWLAERVSDAYLVGGAIRDRLLGRDSQDLDFAVSRDSLPLARELANCLTGSFVSLDDRRGIARVVCSERGVTTCIDLSLLQGGTLEQDLLRRDFTVNSMALPLGGMDPQIVDPHGGQQDVACRLVRAVTTKVFVDDPLRLLRAVRLAAELQFSIEVRTESLLRQHATRIRESAAERKRDELVRVLRTTQSPHWTSTLADTGLLVAVLPQLGPHLGQAVKAFRKTHRLVTALRREDPGEPLLDVLHPLRDVLSAHLTRQTSGERNREDILRMSALLSPLLPDLVKEALMAMRFSRYEASSGRAIADGSRQIVALLDNEVGRRETYRYFRKAGDAGIEALLLALSHDSSPRTNALPAVRAARILDAFFRHHREIIDPVPLIDGNTLMVELGLRPVPEVGRVLERLREAQAVGEVVTKAQALEYLRRP